MNSFFILLFMINLIIQSILSLNCPDSSKYGSNCDKTCPDNCKFNTDLNRKCKIDDGTCYSCNNPLYGPTCNIKCSDKCDLSKGGCNKDTGSCDNCLSGLYGENCDKKCSEGCDLVKGQCTRDGKCSFCKDGYFKESCTKCPEVCELNCNLNKGCLKCKDKNKFGDWCVNDCPKNCSTDNESK